MRVVADNRERLISISERTSRSFRYTGGYGQGGLNRTVPAPPLVIDATGSGSALAGG